jgi:hypothetical protein
MPRPPLKTADSIERAVADIKAAKTAQELRLAQAALMPLLGFSLEQTAVVVGRNKGWVSRNRAQYLRGELKGAEMSPRGGRRNQLLDRELELRLVRHALLNQAWGKSVRDLLGESIFKATGHVPAQSTLTAMLKRAAEIYVPGAGIQALQAYAVRLGEVWSAQARLDSLLKPHRK